MSFAFGGHCFIYMHHHDTEHHSNANAITCPTCKPGKAKITQIYRLGQSKHPYHLIAVSGAAKWGKLKSGAGWISLDYTKKV